MNNQNLPQNPTQPTQPVQPMSPDASFLQTPNIGYQNPPTYQNPKPPKKKKSKGVIIGIIIAVVIVIFAVVFIALNKDSNNEAAPIQSQFTTQIGIATEPQTENTTELKTEETTQEYYEYAKADIAQLAKNIEINGKHISLPCTVGEIASVLDGFNKTIKYDENENFYYMETIISKDDFFIGYQCNLMEYNENISIDSNQVDMLYVFTTDSNFDMSVDGITLRTPIEEIEQKYGELKEEYAGKYILKDLNSNANISFIKQQGEINTYGFLVDIGE